MNDHDHDAHDDTMKTSGIVPVGPTIKTSGIVPVGTILNGLPVVQSADQNHFTSSSDDKKQILVLAVLYFCLYKQHTRPRITESLNCVDVITC